MLKPVDPYGPLTQLYGGTSPHVLQKKNGAVSPKLKYQFGVLTDGPITQFLIPWARDGPIPPGTEDPALGEKLWAYLENEIKTKLK
jgi:retinol dehydrogenase-12